MILGLFERLIHISCKLSTVFEELSTVLLYFLDLDRFGQENLLSERTLNPISICPRFENYFNLIQIDIERISLFSMVLLD
jgi:hypothetical protein